MAKTKQPKTATTTIEAAITDGYAALETLGEEMRSWADNMPENMQGGSKYEEITAAADELEGLSEPDVSDIPEDVRNAEVTYQRATKTSRAARRDEATGMLSAAAEKLREKKDDYEPEKAEVAFADVPKGADPVEALEEAQEKYEEIQSAIDTLADEVTEMQETADGVEFPGMY